MGGNGLAPRLECLQIHVLLRNGLLEILSADAAETEHKEFRAVFLSLIEL